MLLNASTKLAVKCSECGKYNVTEINIFRMRIPTSLRCDCGHRTARIRIHSSRLILEVDCIACEKQHSFQFSLRELMEKPIRIISCAETGMEIAFLGWEENVKSIIEQYNEDMQEVYQSFGLLEGMTTKKA